LASDTVTGEEFTKIFKDATGLDSYLYQPSVKEFASYGFPGADELANMFDYYNLKAGKLRDPKETKKLYSGTTSLFEFFKHNKDFFHNIKKN